MSSSEAVVKHFRQILRHVKSLPSGASPTSSLRIYVSKEFHLGKLEENEKDITSRRQTAYTYSTLVASIDELRRLRQLDSGEKLEPRDKIRATGGRVGLGVPKFADEAEKEFLIRDKDMKYEDRIHQKLTPKSHEPAARDPKNLIDPF